MTSEGRRVVPFYPFLAAIYSVLALAAANPAELPAPERLIAPLGLSVIVAAVAYLAARGVTAGPGRRALLALFAVTLFGGYGWLAEISRGWAGPSSENGDEIALPLTLALAIAGVLVVRRLRGDLAGATRFLNRAALVLLLMPAAGLAWHALAATSTPPASLPLEVTVHPERAAAGSPPPDIYVIILDKYTGSAALRSNYGFDNSGFEEALRQRGFLVPRDGRANYTYTPLALAAMLNWEYVGSFEGYAEREPGEREVFELVERNRTWQFLKSRGYRFVFFPTAFPTTFRNRYADLQLPDPAETVTEFEAVWLRSTPIVPVLRLRCAVLPCNRMRFPYVPEPPDRLDWRFQALADLADSAGPHFAFAHFLLPHEPYLYHADCTYREPYWPLTDSGAEEARVKPAYVAQIRCLNTKVLRLVDELKRRSAVPPVILLQADHGHGRLGREQPPLRLVPPERAEERAQVFAAYHLPGAPDSLAYDGISPVNAMRRTLAFYFGADLPRLPDETWWSLRVPPYEFTRLPRPSAAR